VLKIARLKEPRREVIPSAEKGKKMNKRKRLRDERVCGMGKWGCSRENVKKVQGQQIILNIPGERKSFVKGNLR